MSKAKLLSVLSCEIQKEKEKNRNGKKRTVQYSGNTQNHSHFGCSQTHLGKANANTKQHFWAVFLPTQ